MQEYYLNSEKKICLMELSEFKELEGAYPHKRNLFRKDESGTVLQGRKLRGLPVWDDEDTACPKGQSDVYRIWILSERRRTAVDRGWQFPKDVSWKAGKIIPTECDMHQFLVMILRC